MINISFVWCEIDEHFLVKSNLHKIEIIIFNEGYKVCKENYESWKCQYFVKLLSYVRLIVSLITIPIYCYTYLSIHVHSLKIVIAFWMIFSWLWFRHFKTYFFTKSLCFMWNEVHTATKLFQSLASFYLTLLLLPFSISFLL